MDTTPIRSEALRGMRSSLDDWDEMYVNAIDVGQRWVHPLVESVLDQLASPPFLRESETGSVSMSLMGGPVATLYLHHVEFAAWCEAVTRITAKVGYHPSKIHHRHSEFDGDKLDATWLLEEPNGGEARLRLVLMGMEMDLPRQPNMPSHGLETTHLDLDTEILAACAKLMGKDGDA